MKCRCYYEKHPNYKNYGGRGITVCDEWKNSSISFGNWAMSNGYKENLTLDRIDNEKGYSPDNCRWVTMKEQSKNKRTKNDKNNKRRTRGNVRMVEINGVIKPLRVWLDEYNISVKLFEHRYYDRKWDIEKAIITPKKRK